jgi:hypothetical protein
MSDINSEIGNLTSAIEHLENSLRQSFVHSTGGRRVLRPSFELSSRRSECSNGKLSTTNSWFSLSIWTTSSQFSWKELNCSLSSIFTLSPESQNTRTAMLRQKRYHDLKFSWQKFENGDEAYVYFPVRKTGHSSKLTSYNWSWNFSA